MNKYYVVDTTEKCSNRYLNYDKKANELELDSPFQTERQQTEFTLDELKMIEDKHGLMIVDSNKWQLEEGGNHDKKYYFSEEYN